MNAKTEAITNEQDEAFNKTRGKQLKPYLGKVKCLLVIRGLNLFKLYFLMCIK